MPFLRDKVWEGEYVHLRHVQEEDAEDILAARGVGRVSSTWRHHLPTTLEEEREKLRTFVEDEERWQYLVISKKKNDLVAIIGLETNTKKDQSGTNRFGPLNCRVARFGMLLFREDPWDHRCEKEAIRLLLDATFREEFRTRKHYGPAWTIGFPKSHVFPSKNIEDTHRDHFVIPFQNARADFEWGDEAWSAWPSRPEVVLIRNSRVDCTPKDLYGYWQEENHKFVWVPMRLLTGNIVQGDNTDMVKHLREMDDMYRKSGRRFVGEIVDKKYRKVPLKSIIAVSDELQLDETAKLVLDTAAGLAIEELKEKSNLTE